MLVSIHPRVLAEKPGDGFDWQSYNQQFTTADIPLVDLMGRVCKGYGFAPGIFTSGRSLDTFVEAQLIGLDIDGTMTLAELKAHPWVRAYAGFIYPTYNWTPEEERYRVVFELDRPIKGERAYRLALEVVHEFFPLADRACIDPARLFFGNPRILDEDLPQWYGSNVLPVEDLSLFKQQVLNQRRAAAGQVDRPAASPQPRPYQPTQNREWELVELADRLRMVDPYGMDYATWVKLGSAIAHTYNGSWDAFRVFKNWSDRPGKQPLSEAKWKSMAAAKGNSAGFGSIIHILQPYGAVRQGAAR